MMQGDWPIIGTIIVGVIASILLFKPPRAWSLTRPIPRKTRYWREYRRLTDWLASLELDADEVYHKEMLDTLPDLTVVPYKWSYLVMISEYDQLMTSEGHKTTYVAVTTYVVNMNHHRVFTDIDGFVQGEAIRRRTQKDKTIEELPDYTFFASDWELHDLNNLIELIEAQLNDENSQ